MVAISITNPDLHGVGPVIQVSLSPPISTNPDPKLVETLIMLVDTGASHTSIKTGMAQKLGLAPIGSISVNTASTADVQCFQYAVRMELNAQMVLDPWAVTEMDLAGQPIHGLIGRDILAQCQLVYHGWTGVWTLAF